MAGNSFRSKGAGLGHVLSRVSEIEMERARKREAMREKLATILLEKGLSNKSIEMGPDGRFVGVSEEERLRRNIESLKSRQASMAEAFPSLEMSGATASGQGVFSRPRAGDELTTLQRESLKLQYKRILASDAFQTIEDPVFRQEIIDGAKGIFSGDKPEVPTGTGLENQPVSATPQDDIIRAPKTTDVNANPLKQLLFDLIRGTEVSSLPKLPNAVATKEKQPDNLPDPKTTPDGAKFTTKDGTVYILSGGQWQKVGSNV